MPRIDIDELDTTSVSEPEYDDFVTLVAGLSENTAESGGPQLGFTKLYEDVTTFTADIGAETTGLGFKMAKKLLSLGMKVQYVVYTAKEDLEDAGLEEEDVGFWVPFEDKGLYDIRFIVSGEISKTIAEKMIKTAAERGDAIALIDVPTTEDTAAKIDTWTNSLEAGTVTRKSGIVEDAHKYGAAFSPAVTFKADLTTAFPSVYAYLSCFATYIKRFPEWFAMSGSVRGVTPELISSVSVEIGDAANAILQAREVGGTIEAGHKATNAISNIRPYGYIVWGNRTLHPLDATKGLTASSFLNIRHLCCSIKKDLYRAGRKFTFEPNSDVLWTNFVGAITPLLETMKSGQGIKGYKIIKEVASGKAMLKARVRIIPIEAVEDFALTVEMTDSIEVSE